MTNQESRPEPMAIVLSRVSAHFDDEARREGAALHEITLSIKAGSFVSLIGPSGSGKSTLLRVILGLMEPTSGEVVRNVARPAMVFQNFALFPWLSARENVAFGLKMQGVARRERERVAREKLEEVGLAHLEHHYPAMLSGGQRQRVGLARALAVHPDLLVMDEPFASLDTITAHALKEDLLKIWRSYGVTMVMVNHLLPDAIELSDTVVLLGAHPGHIEKVVEVDLPRPRDTRSHQFYAHVDALTESLRKIS